MRGTRTSSLATYVLTFIDSWLIVQVLHDCCCDTKEDRSRTMMTCPRCSIKRDEHSWKRKRSTLHHVMPKLSLRKFSWGGGGLRRIHLFLPSKNYFPLCFQIYSTIIISVKKFSIWSEKYAVVNEQTFDRRFDHRRLSVNPRAYEQIRDIVKPHTVCRSPCIHFIHEAAIGGNGGMPSDVIVENRSI